MTLCYEIRKIRQKAFLSQTAFAKEIGVVFSTVNRWENGKTEPTLDAMRRIHDFCENNGFSYQDIEDAWLSSKL